MSKTMEGLYSLLYLTLVLTILFTLHTQIAHKLLVGHHPLHLKKSPHLPLRFNSDGTFKILQVADMHYGTGMLTRCRDVLASEFDYCSDLNTTRFLKRIIQSEKPDFIAFTGDNIFGPSTHDAAESLLRAFGPAMDSGLPWAAVLGNHDQESTMTREELMSFISLMDYSVSQTNPPVDDLSSAAEGDVTKNIDGFVETERWFKEFELMDGLRNLSFVGFVVFLRDIRYNLLRKLGETKP